MSTQPHSPAYIPVDGGYGDYLYSTNRGGQMGLFLLARWRETMSVTGVSEWIK